MNVLGVSALFHDSAAALVCDGEVVAAAEEERFSRLKHDARLPVSAIRYCLDHKAGPLDAVVYYEDTPFAFDRFVETCVANAPRSLSAWNRGFERFATQRFTVFSDVADLTGCAELFSVPHHYAHAASAFYPSPFREAAVLVVDGVGEWASTTIARGEGATIEPLAEVRYPHSLGLFYSVFTVYCGFKANSGEYKLMGLAPFGEPRYAALLEEQVIDIRADGSFNLNQRYFQFEQDVPFGSELEELLGRPARVPETSIDQFYADVAASVQAVLEHAVGALAAEAVRLTGASNLCLAGGVALNCVANGKLQRNGAFQDIWIQPAGGDAGGALGAALAGYFGISGDKRQTHRRDGMRGAFLGPSYRPDEIVTVLDDAHVSYERVDDERRLAAYVAGRLAAGDVVGVFRGRMEFGPRALGHRSILASAAAPGMQSRINEKIKHRESWRPFAAMALAADVPQYFELTAPSPYMLFVAPVLSWKRPLELERRGSLVSLLQEQRSDIPAATHVDGSCRVQSVEGTDDPFLFELLHAYRRSTGMSALVNTSLNVRGEPIVCSPEEALQCFLSTEMDVLVMERFVIERSSNPTTTNEVIVRYD